MIKKLFFIVVLCLFSLSVYAIRLEPAAVLSGDVIATDSNGAVVDIHDGTVVSVYSLDGRVYGSVTIENNHYLNLPVAADNVTEIVKFKVGEIYAEEEYMFIPGEILELDLNVKNWVSDEPENNEGEQTDDSEEDDSSSSEGTRRSSSRREEPEEAVIEDIVIPKQTETDVNQLEEEPPSKETVEEAPITESHVTDDTNSNLGYGLIIAFIVVLIGVGIYLIIFKRGHKLRKI